MAKSPPPKFNYRSSETGEFVTEKEAKGNPKETEKERRPPPKPPSPPASKPPSKRK
jgi:hypothetical protein